ncbi:MAG: DNA polymerase III subunit delta [Anaerolineales bacterium]|nr:DNA polymerase III subunit delta [Anaerolineales bacterium]
MPPSFYLLHGPNEFGQAEFMEGLRAKMGDPAYAALNTTVLNGGGGGLTLAEVRAACDTLPFLSDYRLVLIEGWLTRLLSRVEAVAGDAAADGDEAPETLSTAAGGLGPKETMAALAAYLPQLPPSTKLVLMEQRDLPVKNVVLKAATGAEWALVRHFDLKKGEELTRWIRSRAKTAGGEFSHAAAEALGEVENDPRALEQEIAKLLTYVNFARAVELDDVQTLTPAGGEAVIFDLVDAMGQRRGPQAMRELHKLLATQDPFYVLTMIIRQYRLILQARELLDGRAGEHEVAAALGLKPYPTGKLCAQARNFSLPQLEGIYRRLLDYDTGIKTGQLEAAAALDTLVASLTTA